MNVHIAQETTLHNASNIRPAEMLPSDANHSAGQQRRRRARAARACDLCRIKKNKCDEGYPCSFCKNRNVQCVYQGREPGGGRFTDDYVRQLEEQVQELSSIIETRDGGGVIEPRPAVDDPEIVSPTQQLASTGTRYQPKISGVTDGHAEVHLGAEEAANKRTPLSPASTRHAGEQEVSGVNRHTQNVEYYGSSSSVALLSHINNTGKQHTQGQRESHEVDDEDAAVLLSSLHNPAFRPPDTHGNSGLDTSKPISSRNHPLFKRYLDNYFSSIHYIHPLLDKRLFLGRCQETIWSAAGSTTPVISSFVALYYSILSLGALVGIRDEEQLVGDLGNRQWSRRLFLEARRCCNQLGMVTDLEMVQCYFMMSKVCQNELNAHWAYMYVGLAVRTALAMGINREPRPDAKRSLNKAKAESRTWWGLYSLETEMSFALGRPDTLGADIHHNRNFPLTELPSGDGGDSTNPELLEPPHCQIIKYMVDFSRIITSIFQRVYLTDTTIADTINSAYQIDRDLHQWVDSLPELMRPKLRSERFGSLQAAKDPLWAKRQRLVLTIRYHNVRILLFGYLLLRSSANERSSIPGCLEGVQKCLDSAKKTIDIIYQMYEHNDFFRTWFYNTTYTVFAASMILVNIAQESPETDIHSSLKLVDMAVEILETMDECAVAQEAARLLNRAREKAANLRLSQTSQATDQAQFLTAAAAAADGTVQMNQYWDPLGILDYDVDLDIAFQADSLDQGNSMFMPLDG